jgi:predicted secreted hydrolase
LKVTGTLARGGGKAQTVSGSAWLDHEWSSEYLDTEATGWDWIGLNLDDGGALMAFRIRGRDGATRWAGGTLRSADGTVRAFAPDELRFAAGKRWQSPRTGTSYPVEWRIVAGDRTFELRPLMPDQENDARLSTGAVYWEGAVTALESGARVGRGYLELTGYGEPLRLP